MSPVLTLVLFIVTVALTLLLGFAVLYLRKVQKRQADGLFFESRQGPIYYKVYGKKGPTILMIHGLGASTFAWRNIAPPLAENHRVVVFDLWGFGNSSKDIRAPMNLDSQVEVIKELVDHLNIKHYHIVGHSMGAEIAIWLKHVDSRVGKVVAITPSAHPSLVSDWLHRFAWVAKLTPLVLTTSAIKRLLLKNLADPKQVTQEMIWSYFEPYLDPAAHVTFAAALNIISDSRVWGILEHLDEKVLVIFAGHDLVINRKITKLIADKLSYNQTLTHPWAGHLAMEDDPSWLVERIFLALKS